MSSLALAELRRHPSRFVSVILAVLIGVAFAVATSVFTSSMGTAFGQSAAAQYSSVDLVVRSDGRALEPSDEDVVRAIPGVSEVAAPRTQWIEQGGGSRMLPVRTLPPQAQRWMTLVDGTWPGDGQLVTDTATAERRNWSIGDWVTGSVTVWSSESGEPAEPVQHRFELVGLVDTGQAAIAQAGDGAWSTVTSVAALFPQDTSVDELHLTVAAGSSADQVRDAVQQSLPGTKVLTRAEVTADLVSRLTGDADAIGYLLSAFVVMAAVVAVMVVGSTFAILQAQRRRQIALLRCIGATGSQVRRSARLEAAAIGLVGSVLGGALGVGAGYGLGLLLGVNSAAFTVRPLTVVLLVLAGTLLTVVAAIAPTRRASRIPPLAALRPVDPAPERRAASRTRVVLGVLALVAGALGLVGGAAIGQSTGLLLSLVGGVVTTAGFLAVLPSVLPWLLRLLSPLAAALRSPGRLALANASRNPGRSAAACAVLAVGVGAVTTLLVAADSAEATIEQATGVRNQLDLVLTGDDLPADLVQAVGRIEGIEAVGTVPTAVVSVSGNGETYSDMVVQVPDQQLLDAVRNAGDLSVGQVALPEWMPQSLGLRGGDTVTVTGPSGSVDLVISHRPMTDDGSLVVLLPDMVGVDPLDGERALWAKFTADADPDAIISAVNREVGDLPISVGGSGLLRAAQSELIGQLVLIAVGLLGVALVIALVGVGNTVGLSVLERTGESGLLRALGLRRGQLRWVVALEAGALALIAGVLGVLFGLGFGLAATGSMLGLGDDDLTFSVPWAVLGLLVVGAIVAGMVATTLPARRAARVTPMEALARS